MANMFAMTVLLIALGLTGNSILAAEVGIVQGATLAVFYAFSANARSLILNKTVTVTASSVMAVRMLIVIPLALASYWLSVGAAGVTPVLAIILIIRRVIEWLSEVHLSEMERLDNRPFAIQYFITQSLLLLIAFGWLIADLPFPYFGLLMWALFPLLLSFKFIYGCFVNFSSLSKELLIKMLPHLGSSAVIGIGVFVFRLLILLLVGKETAGDLYTAFAIGGLTGSVFANALGASIALHEQRSGKRHFPKFVRLILYLSLLLGILVFVAATLQFHVLGWLGKTYFFWQATGLSLMGGVVMVYAQRIRFRLLQQDEEHDVYGPDMMMNTLLITSIPFIYYLFGLQAMAALSLLSAMLAFAFYRSYQLAEMRSSAGQTDFTSNQLFIPAMLLFPLFFQFSSGIFRDSAINFSSGGMLHLLPIPISAIACFGGIFMIAAYRQVRTSLTYIFFTCLLMMATTTAISQGDNIEEQAKFILLVQFVLPMFGLVLGQMYQVRSQPALYSLERAFLYVLLFIVPLQLLITWIQGYTFLSPYLYVFSIYQHLQYVPIIFVSAFLVAFCGLWSVSKYKKTLLLLALFMGIYVAAAVSVLAIAMLIAGLFGYAIYQWKHFSDKALALLALLVLLLTFSFMQYEGNFISFKVNYLAESKQPIEIKQSTELKKTTQLAKVDEIAPNIAQRMYYWKYYAENIVSSPQTFLLGHAKPPNRTKYPSAHNYYLDFIYNFGFLALLPMLMLLVYTLTFVYRFRKEVCSSTSLLSLSAVVLFLIIIDNALMVGLRQPYSGIFIFFLWGILISKLKQNSFKANNVI